MAIPPKQQGIVDSAPPEMEDAADVASEPGGEPATEPAPAAAPDASAPVGAAEQYSPDDQHWHDQMLLNAHKLMYSKTGFPTMLKKLADGKSDIAQSIGHTLAMLLYSLQKSSGNKIPDEVVLDVGVELLDDFLQIATTSGMLKKQFLEAAKSRATFVAFKAYGDISFANGDYNAQDIQDAQNELTSLGLDPKKLADATGATKAAADHVAKFNQMKAAAPQGQPPGAAPAPAAAPPGAPAGIVNQMAAQ